MPAIVIELIKKMLEQFLTYDILCDLIIECLEFAAKQSYNEVDDKLVEIVKKALKKA